MASQNKQLAEIVRLKKQIAESEYRAAFESLKIIDAQIDALNLQISSASTEKSPSSGVELSSRLKFLQRQMAGLEDLQSCRQPLVSNLEAAREKLKNIILSEDVLRMDHSNK